MLYDTETVSEWYVVNKGLKVYSSCPKCENTNVIYRRAWMKGMYGIAPECNACRKLFPVRMKPNNAGSKKPNQLPRLGVRR
jgi:hypothetical protein